MNFPTIYLVARQDSLSHQVAVEHKKDRQQ